MAWVFARRIMPPIFSLVPSDGSAQPAQITAGNYDYLHHNWLPDSRHIICVSNRFRNREEYLGYDLLKIEIQTGEILQLTQNLWLVSYPNPLRPSALLTDSLLSRGSWMRSMRRPSAPVHSRKHICTRSQQMVQAAIRSFSPMKTVTNASSFHITQAPEWDLISCRSATTAPLFSFTAAGRGKAGCFAYL